MRNNDPQGVTAMATGNDGSAAGTVNWIGFSDADAVREAASRRILDAAARAIHERGRFVLVIAGGSTPREVYRTLRGADADWPRWHVYFGDERCLPAGDPERNSTMAAQAWLDHVAIPPARIHAIPAERGADAAARAYSETLRGVGDFDLVLLGLGEDGHTASLFPGDHPGDAADAPDALAVFNAPKPPPERVSLSANRLSRTRAAMFLVTGEGKRDAVAQWHRGADIPARSIRPPGGVDVLVDSMLLPDDASQGTQDAPE